MIELLNSTLTELTTLLGKLWGLPSYMLVLMVCLIAGFALKRSKWFPNEGIPLAVIGTGALLMALIADPRADTLPLRVWLVKNVAFGAIIGGIAWALHYNRRKLPIVKRFFSDDTEFVAKPTQKQNPEN